MLYDSEHLLLDEAEREEKPPLYNDEDITTCWRLWQGSDYHEPVTVGPFTVELYDAGHIFGSAIIKFRRKGRRSFFPATSAIFRRRSSSRPKRYPTSIIV